MLAFRSARTFALAGAAMAVTTLPAAAQEAPQERAAQPANEVGAEPAGPLPHAMFAERKARRTRFVQSGGKRANSSVQLALEWLKNHQNEAGYWDAEKFSRECRINRCGGPGGAVGDVGVTGAVLLAFLGASETPSDGPYRNVVARGLEYLRETQDAEGCFGDRSTPHWLHDHMWAAQAMTDAYGMTGARRWKDSAYRAVSFVLAAENPYLGWGPGVRDGFNDTTRTALAVSVLHIARATDLYDLATDSSAFKGAHAWIDKMTDPDSGRIGDVSRGGVGDPTTFPQLSGPALTAAGLLVKLQAGGRPTSKARRDIWNKHGEIVREARPRHPGVRDVERAADEAGPDFTLWYWGARSMFHAGRQEWLVWKKPLIDRLVALQWDAQGRDERGSWDTADDHASHGGRVFVTALACLTLEVPYRDVRITDRGR